MTLLSALLFVGCKDAPTDTGDKTWACTLDSADAPFAKQIGCLDDFQVLASEPISAAIPGARSGKTVVDRVDDHALYFQNSQTYPIHWEFASAHLSGNGLPIVPDLGLFNTTEYYSPDRRFILGAVTFYEEPGVWAYEISPYDTASAELIETAFDRIRDNTYFGDELMFHPTSISVEAQAELLPDDIPVISTDELFAGITYQPLNLATSMGQLSFKTEDELEAEPPGFREIVVLEAVPNDISVVAGIITAEFQTPLAHINVLSQNRGTPNMALRGAFDDEELRALEGKWVELTVGATEWSMSEVSKEEADEWWEENKPDPLVVTPLDTETTAFTPIRDIVDLEEDLSDQISANVPTFGGKATNFSVLAQIGDDVPTPEAFAIPMAHYNAFMEANGFWDEVDVMLADEAFQTSGVVRKERLEQLRDDIKDAPVDEQLVADITDYLNTNYPDTRVRMRSSTNAEDISGFNGAGLYTSKSADPNDDDYPIEDALRKVWASTWSLRAFEERSYYSIEHRDIGMALLCHRSFPDEEANGVAITRNIFDSSGLEPAFYINVQYGEASVVLPEAGVTADRFLYYFNMPGSPVVYLATSSLTDEPVLSDGHIYDLGKALDAIHAFYMEAYGGDITYAMDVEFKIDEAQLWVKQARPY